MTRVVTNRRLTGLDVYAQALARLRVLYKAGHRLVVSFSAGKDSGVILELAVEAARAEGRLPVEVVLKEEEINYPGTYEYAERTAARPDVRMSWFLAHQPALNIFDRAEPYFWVMDPQLSPDQWVRRPPAWATTIPDLDISAMVTPARFPVAGQVTPGAKWRDRAPGPQLVTVLGLRVSESMNRAGGLHASGGYMSGANRHGVYYARPIYDWTDGDVWRYVHTRGLDYNRAYDVMLRLGVPLSRMRIAPPTMNTGSLSQFRLMAHAYPAWFARVCARLRGVRTAVQFGARMVRPSRRLGETWRACFERECLGPDTPPWIRDRAASVARQMESRHAHHATTPLPDTARCLDCTRPFASWRGLAHALWSGDPFSVAVGTALLPYVEPSFFRPGAGEWAKGDQVSW